MTISFDLSPFSIVARYLPLDDEPSHMTLERVLCEAVAGALHLPAPLTLDAHAKYATTSYCGTASEDPIVELRIRVLGFAFGQGSKKTTEYLGVSFVTLDAQGKVVGWSEDLHKINDSGAGTNSGDYWRAVNANKVPPKPKARAKDCALLTFVTVKGEEKSVAPITDAIRALVAEVAPPVTATAIKAPAKAAKKPAMKAPTKKPHGA